MGILDKTYKIIGQKLAIFALTVAKVKIEGKPDVIYYSEESLMPTYLEFYEIIEEYWTLAKEKGISAPRILLAGPIDSGKTSVARIISNLSIRMGWKLAFVELDVDQGSLAVPGCISAAVIKEPWDIEEGIPIESPIVFYYGHLSPEEASEHFKELIKRLANVVEKKISMNKESKPIGMLINTPGWIEGAGNQLLIHQIETFECNIVIVIGKDKLYNQLLAHAQDVINKGRKGFNVVKFPISGGVVMRDVEYRKKARNLRVNNYFCGSRGTLLPVYVNTVSIFTFEIYRIGGNKAPWSALPIGAIKSYEPLKISSIKICKEMENTLLAISYASNPEQTLSANVAGFIQILEIDVKNQLLSYQAPNQNPFPGKILIAGDFKVKSLTE